MDYDCDLYSSQSAELIIFQPNLTYAYSELLHYLYCCRAEGIAAVVVKIVKALLLYMDSGV